MQISLKTPSMEPRPFSRGYGIVEFGRLFGPEFPSMEPRPFSRGYTKGERGWQDQGTSFNGATAFQPWIPSRKLLNSSRGLYLQWSHGLSAVDTVIGKRIDLVTCPGLQWSHGLSAVDT